MARLRGTPGLAEAKVSEAEREVDDAEEKVWSSMCGGLTLCLCPAVPLNCVFRAFSLFFLYF